MEDGYYWCVREQDGTKFVALREAGSWYVPGVRSPVADPSLRLVCPVEDPDYDQVEGVRAALLRGEGRGLPV